MFLFCHNKYEIFLGQVHKIKVCAECSRFSIAFRHNQLKYNTWKPGTNIVLHGVMKPADKGSIIVVMTPKDYWNMCYRHLSDKHFVIQITTTCFLQSQDTSQNNLPLLQRFTKQFVLEGFSMILKFNYFYIKKSFFHQIKGTAMGTKFAVVGSNLVVTYKNINYLHFYPKYTHKILLIFYCETTLDFQMTFSINGLKILI